MSQLEIAQDVIMFSEALVLLQESHLVGLRASQGGWEHPDPLGMSHPRPLPQLITKGRLLSSETTFNDKQRRTDNKK